MDLPWYIPQPNEALWFFTGYWVGAMVALGALVLYRWIHRERPVVQVLEQTLREIPTEIEGQRVRSPD